jgi:putative effector of murein hydrolase
MLTHPLMSLFVTIGSYLLAQWVQKKAGGHSLLNPIVIAIIMVIAYLIYFDIPYPLYLEGVDFMNLLLGSVTVAFAIPLYNQLPLIRQSIVAISIAIFVACFVAAFSAYYLAGFMGASKDIQLAIAEKSVTIAIAISIANKIGADPALSVFFVFTTGIIGSVIATGIFSICKIEDEKAIGLSLGVACHGLGLARAIQYSETAGVFAAIGMSLMGFFSGVILPIVFLQYLV